jgi:CBS domain-containing protein
MRAREIMSTPVVTVRPEATLKEVAELMATHRVSGLPVVDRFGHLVGIVSESDFLTRMEGGEIGPGLVGLLARVRGTRQSGRAQTAVELMTSRVITATSEATVGALTHLMNAYDINRIPIVEEGRLIGIVTRADILRTMARSDEAITEEVRWHLLHDLWIDTDALKITTQHGVVTIAGEVATYSDAALVGRWAAVTAGVVGVETRDLRYRLDDRRIAVTP